MKPIVRTPFIMAGLVLITSFALWPVLTCGFILMDDDLYVTKNPHVLGGISFANAAWFLTHTHEFLYHPLSLLTFMFDHAIFGLNPAGYHAVNLIIHIGSCVLLFLLLQSLTASPWRSAAAAALFAVHPLRVESVAWVSERKDVLAVFFGMLAFLAYVRFAKGRKRGCVYSPTDPRGGRVHPPYMQRSHPVASGTVTPVTGGAVRDADPTGPDPTGLAERQSPARVWLYYALTVVMLMLSLLAKPALVTFPFLLLVLDFWTSRTAGTARRNQELGPDSGQERETAGSARPTSAAFARNLLPLLLEKLPLIVLVVFWAYLSRSLGATDSLAGQMQVAGPLPSLSSRLLAAPVAGVFYLVNHVRFTRLAIPYPMPAEGWPISYTLVSLAVLIAITAVAGWQWRKRPWLIAGWAWFLIALAPFVGILYIGDYALADRYTYLADIGLCFAIIGSIPDAVTSTIARRCASASTALAILLVLSLFSRAQARYWRDDSTLFAHSVQVTNGNATAYCGLAIAAMNGGDHAAAITYFKQAATIAPDERIYLSIGTEHAQLGDYRRAYEAYHKAIRINPDFAPAYHDLGVALRAQAAALKSVAPVALPAGTPPKTIDECRQALDAAPNDPALHARLGELLDEKFESKSAISEYRAALRLDPAHLTAHINLGIDLAEGRRFDEAIEHYQDALALSPTNPDAHYNLGISLAKLGHPEDAAHEFREALRYRPDDRDARTALNELTSR